MTQEDTMTRMEIGRFVGSVLMDIVACRLNGMFLSEAMAAVGNELLDATDDLDDDTIDDVPDPLPTVSFVWVGSREPVVGDYLSLPGDDGGFYCVKPGDVAYPCELNIYTRVERQAASE